MQFSRWFGVRWKAFICFVLLTLKVKACPSLTASSRKCQNQRPRQGSWSCWPGIVLTNGGHGHLLFQGQAGLTWKVKQGSSPCLRENAADCGAREPRGPGKELWSPAQQVTATSSKWARFVLSPRNSSHVDREQPTPLQRDPGPAAPAQAKQGTPGTPRAQASREGLSRPTDAVQLPRATHPTTSGPERPCGKTSWDARTPWAEGGPLVQEPQNPQLPRLCDLFTTGEDFDDDL